MSSEQSSSASSEDSRKRKLENIDDEESVEVKIAKPSLGLSLLQSYDAEDDYMTSDEEPTSPSTRVNSSVTRNVFIEEMTDEDQADENPTDHISSVKSEVVDGVSLSVSEPNNPASDVSESSVSADSKVEDNVAPATVTAEKSVNESNENVQNTVVPEVSANDVHVEPVESSAEVIETVDAKISSLDVKIETEPASVEKDSTRELEVNKIKQTDHPLSTETSDSKNFSSCQTSSTKENELKPIRPDYNFSVFGTSSETGSSDERVSAKPAKKVKLNRSKFIRSVDESSNEAKPNAVTSSPVLPSSSEPDSKPVIPENSTLVKPKIEVAENNVCTIDQRNETISAKSTEIVENTSVKIEDSTDLNETIIPITDENISVETFDIDQSMVNTEADISTDDTTDLNQLVAEPLATKDIDLSLNSIEEHGSLVEEGVAESLENVPQSIDEIVERESSTTKIDSPFDTESFLVDEEIVGPTDIPDILQRDENDDSLCDNMIEVIDQDISTVKDENHSDSEVAIIKEIKNENPDITFTGEVKLLEIDAAENLKNDEAPIDAAEDLVEELMDENSILEESTAEGIFVEELKNENAVVEELTDANTFVEETKDVNSFIVELKDENLMVEESKDENLMVEESKDENLMVEESKDENSMVEESKDENLIVEESKDEDSIVEESKDENLIVEESKDESSVIEELNENPLVDPAEEMKNENPDVDVEDSKNEKTDASPLSFNAEQGNSFDLEESPDEDDKKEPAVSTVEVRDTKEPPHRPLKIIIRKKEEKLVVVEDVPRSKRRGRKSAKKLQKEKSRMKGEESKKKIVKFDETADLKMNISVGETLVETNTEFEPIDAMKRADTEIKEEAVVSATSEITGSIASQSAQVVGELPGAAESDDEIFKDAMDTLEPVSAEMNLEKQVDVSEQSSSLGEGTNDPVVSAGLINSETVLNEKISDKKSLKTDEPSPTESSTLDKIANESMEFDVEEASAKTVSEAPSKLEQALTRKLKNDKVAESTAVPAAPLQEISGTDKSTPEAPPEEPPPVKENLKLHLSVQGNRVSIKKNVAAETVVAPLPEATQVPSLVTDPELPPPRVKRQYRKRAKPIIDPALLTEEKSYKLRTRNIKNPPEDVTPKKTKGRKSAAVVAAAATTVTIPDPSPLPVASPPPKKEKVLRETPASLPVTVEIHPPPDKKVTTPAGKVRPIRLKIKNPGGTIECTSKYSPVTIEKIGGPQKGAVSENIVDILEEVRKKESQTVVPQEQPAWSGTDLQRVERLLKESNITITPVTSVSASFAEPVSPSPNSILKPILTAAKEKSARKSYKAHAVPPSSSTIGAASITPIYADSKDKSAESSSAHNLNIILKPLDFEEQLSHWKISKPGRAMDVIRIPSPASEQQKQQPKDVKLEIRKKIASSERRRQIQEPEVVITVDEASNLENAYRSRRRDAGMPEAKPLVKEVRRKSRSRPAEITLIKPNSEVTSEIQKSAEQITCRLPSKAKIVDEFILPDSTPPVLEEADTFTLNAENATHGGGSQSEVPVKPKAEPQVMLEPKLEAQVILDAEAEDVVIVEPEAETAVTESKDEVCVMAEPKDEAEAAAAPISEEPTAPLDVEQVAVKPEIEIVAHIIHPKGEDVAPESTLKVEKVEPIAKSEVPPPKTEYEPAETSTEVKSEAQIPSVSSSVEDISPAVKSETTSSPQTVPEVKQITPESKPKTGKQMPDLLPINKPSMTLVSVQIPSITSHLVHMSSLSASMQSQRASMASEATSSSPVPSSPGAATQRTAIPSPFVSITPQIKLSMTPLTSKMLQEARTAPQSTPSPHMPAAAAFRGPLGASVSTMSMTPSGSPRMVDSGVNTPSRSFIDSTTPTYSNLPPLMFPKKRGRPTKAMVAAREAYRQSQEAIEGFKRPTFEQTLAMADAGSTPQPMPPGDESGASNITVDLVKLPIKRGRKIKSEKSDQTDGSDDNASAEKLPMDPEREMEELKRLEEDRIRKEQERERKNELRRLKAKERSDLEKAKKLRQRQKAEERHRKVQEQRRLLQEQKKKLEEEIKKLPGYEAGMVTAADVSQMSNGSFLIDDDSNSMSFDPMQRLKKTKMEVYDPDGNNLTVDQIAEYQWPIQGGELYMIQEQISNFLGVKSFKRKYPDIKRRPVDSEERAYLVDSGLVSETLCDLGITAVCSAEVLDIMCSDFPEKYEELRKFMREKQMKELSFKQKAWANGLGYKLLMADGSKQDLKKRAMESVSNWNSALNKSRHEDRRSAIDLQTFIIHYPKSKTQNMTTPTPKIGSYPISILPGQFCDFYKEYTSTELRYLPVNTVIYGPVKHPSAARDADGSQTDSDDSSSSDESSSTTSEGTQATEDTLEDMDKDMSLDESLLAEKLPDGNTSVREDRDSNRREMTNGVADVSSADEGKVLCKVCLGDENRNKENVAEVLIYCSQCCSSSHPTCLDLSLNMVPHIKSYKWQCPDCKNCARCKEFADEDKMLFCDICDRGYHIYCVGLKKVPSGSWQCHECTAVDDQVNRENLMLAPNLPTSIPIKIEG